MVSKVIRRTHMYLALFLAPWVFMYALSTTAMNHRAFFDSRPAEWETEREMDYQALFDEDAERWMVAEQILKDLSMEGAYHVRGRLDRSITIVRQSPVAVKRITYTAESQKLRIERQVFQTPAFLEHLHRRSGYRHNYVTDTLWGLCVDLFILSTVLWAVSGLWMWWELKVTRRWGAVCIASGVTVFGFFLLTI